MLGVTICIKDQVVYQLSALHMKYIVVTINDCLKQTGKSTSTIQQIALYKIHLTNFCMFVVWYYQHMFYTGIKKHIVYMCVYFLHNFTQWYMSLVLYRCVSWVDMTRFILKHTSCMYTDMYFTQYNDRSMAAYLWKVCVNNRTTVYIQFTLCMYYTDKIFFGLTLKSFLLACLHHLRYFNS